MYFFLFINSIFSLIESLVLLFTSLSLFNQVVVFRAVDPVKLETIKKKKKRIKMINVIKMQINCFGLLSRQNLFWKSSAKKSIIETGIWKSKYGSTQKCNNHVSWNVSFFFSDAFSYVKNSFRIDHRWQLTFTLCWIFFFLQQKTLPTFFHYITRKNHEIQIAE